jgi:hypothetical protein
MICLRTNFTSNGWFVIVFKPKAKETFHMARHIVILYLYNNNNNLLVLQSVMNLGLYSFLII